MALDAQAKRRVATLLGVDPSGDAFREGLQELFAEAFGAYPVLTDGAFTSALQYDYGNAPIQNALAWAVASTASFCPVRVYKDMVLNSIVWTMGTGASSGNYDIGLYEPSGADLTQVWARGSTACPATNAQTSETGAGGIRLKAGQLYYVGMAFDNITATPRHFSLGASIQSLALNGAGVGLSKATSFPLPATVTAPGTSGFFPYVALRTS